MRSLIYSFFLFFSITIFAQSPKVDSLYQLLSKDERIAQLFIVMDSVNIDSTALTTFPTPAYFIFSGKGVGNLRKMAVSKVNHSTIICNLTDGLMRGVNNQVIPSNAILQASQLGGNRRDYLPYLIHKSTSAGSNSFCFDLNAPWVESFDFSAIKTSPRRFISSEYPANKGISLNSLTGYTYIDVFPFPSNFFEQIVQVPLTEDSLLIQEPILAEKSIAPKNLLTNILNGDGLLYSTNYQQDFFTLKEVISNNLIPKKVLESAVKRSIANRLGALTGNNSKTAINDKLEEIQIARQGVALIANEKLFLPLKSLDSIKVVLLNVGLSNPVALSSAVKFYTPNSSLITIATLDSATIANVKQQTQSATLIIIATKENKLVSLSNAPILEFLKSVTLNKNTILANFDNRNDFTVIKDAIPFNAIIAGYQDDNFTQQIIAENIFGGGGFEGKSPFVVKGVCDKGQGIINVPSKLGRALPEEVEMSSETLAKIDDVVNMGINAKAMPGCEVLVARNGKIVFQKAYGNYIYEPNMPISDTTLYDIASVTKIIGSLPQIMKLYDEQKLNIDTTLETYLPNLAATNKGKLVLKDILTHQAGLVPFIPFYQNTIDKSLTIGNIFSNRYNNTYSIKIDDHLFFNRYSVSRADLLSSTPSDVYTIKVARNLYLNKTYPDSMYAQLDSSKVRPPGKYLYSDCGYYYFKKIIEQNGHHSLDTLLNINFLKPLGMLHTTYNPLNKFPLEQIAPTEQDLMFRKQTVRGYVHDPGAAMLGGVAGHAGLFSTASDLAIMMQMYLNGGTYGGRRYLQESTLKRFTAQAFPNSRRGIGFDKREPDPKKINPVSDYCSALSFGHSGFTGTLVWADPKYNLVYIFLSNRVYPDAYNKKLIKMDIRSKIQDVIYQSLTDK